MRTRVMPLVLVLALAGGTAGCEGDSTRPVMDPADLPAMEQDGVRAAIVLEDITEDVVTLAISVDARALELGAYQGSLEFDTGRLVLLEAEAPHGQDGFRVVNVVAPGTVRFAGFTTEGFTSPVAVRLRLQGAGGVSAQDLTLALDVAGTLEGQTVARSQYQTPRELFADPAWRVR